MFSSRNPDAVIEEADLFLLTPRADGLRPLTWFVAVRAGISGIPALIPMGAPEQLRDRLASGFRAMAVASVFRRLSGELVVEVKWLRVEGHPHTAQFIARRVADCLLQIKNTSLAAKTHYDWRSDFRFH